MNEPLLPLYPQIEPYRTGVLQVSSRHEVHYEECGNPAGAPVVILHGGPGAGVAAFLRQSHDPARYRIVLFDQRGSGKSRPLGDLVENTTAELVADIELLRSHLGIEQWQVVGGSWGSTLALAYGLAHPERLSGMILRGIFTGRQRETGWFYQHGASMIRPEAFAAFQAPIPIEERGDMIAAYHRRLTGPAGPERMAAARAWSNWEHGALHLISRALEPEAPELTEAFARIECHYFQNGCFLPHDGWMLEAVADSKALRAVPCHIIHGRYDLVTPIDTALALAQAWPEAHLTIVADAGHSGTEPGIADAMVRASAALFHKTRNKTGATPPLKSCPTRSLNDDPYVKDSADSRFAGRHVGDRCACRDGIEPGQ
jgi:proline iminopeptidase